MEEYHTDQPPTPRRRRRPAIQQPISTPPEQNPAATAHPSHSASAQPEPPIGERWGEFPSPERQAELEQRLLAWDKESDHGERSGPFVDLHLTGADVFWLAAREVGRGNVASGRHLLSDPNLLGLDLFDLHLEGVHLDEAQLQDAKLWGAQLQNAWLEGAQLQGVKLILAQLHGAHLAAAQLQRASLGGAQLQESSLFEAQLQGASLVDANLQGALLGDAQLQGANLMDALLQTADLSGAGLEGADFTRSDLRAVDLRGALLDMKTRLIEPRLDAQMQVADVLWNGASLIQVDWEQVPHLGDEEQARQTTIEDWVSKGEQRAKTPADWLAGYQAAARAYRQLAVALRGQGVTEPADRFTYRAQIMQRKVLWWQIRSGKFSKLGSYLFSLFLAALTGYGFRMWRIIVAYALIVLAFAAAYWGLGFQAPPGLTFWQAIIVSVTAFHGRVFSNPFTLNEPQIAFTALEAIFGLVVEGVFIAMLTQRFFSR